jgi:tripartite-type tricarboxylate transporter receptor subunit TctC
VTGCRAFLAAALACVAGGAFAQAPSTGSGQAWPSKPIRIVVPFTPGGSTDILGRAIGQKLAESLGQQVIVENRPGAGGSIGAETVARAAPDGYTLLMGHIGTLAVNPTLYPKLGYDPVKSFAPVAWVARVTNVLVVNPSVPAANVQELVALARAQPGRLRYASGGNGSAAHLAVEYFKLQTQTDIVHVPYKGTGPAVTDLLGGQVEVMMSGAPALIPHVRAGKLRALGISSLQRAESFADLPTIAEAGVPGFEALQWYGLVAPAGTPEPIVARINAEVNRALLTPELKTRLVSEGAEAAPATPQAFGAFIAAEIARWRPVIQKAGLRAE